MQTDIAALGIAVAPRLPDEEASLAELRHSTRLKMPDCCALALALAHHATLATTDAALAAAARAQGVPIAGDGEAR
jgi:predicted nucleic acid-binding protein